MAAAEEKGLIRLVHTYPDDMPLPSGTTFEERTENLSRSTTYTEQVPMFSPDFPIIGEGYKLKLFMKADASDTIVQADSTLKLSAIKYKTDKKGGIIAKSHSVLTLADFMGATASVALVAGVWQEIGSITVGSGQALQVGDDRGSTVENANGRFYALIKDDTP